MASLLLGRRSISKLLLLKKPYSPISSSSAAAYQASSLLSGQAVNPNICRRALFDQQTQTLHRGGPWISSLGQKSSFSSASTASKDPPPPSKLKEEEEKAIRREVVESVCVQFILAFMFGWAYDNGGSLLPLWYVLYAVGLMLLVGL